MAKTASRERLGRSGNSTGAPTKVESKPTNRSLSAAKAAKQDEFYTQYVDIQKEVEKEGAFVSALTDEIGASR